MLLYLYLNDSALYDMEKTLTCYPDGVIVWYHDFQIKFHLYNF